MLAGGGPAAAYFFASPKKVSKKGDRGAAALRVPERGDGKAGSAKTRPAGSDICASDPPCRPLFRQRHGGRATPTASRHDCSCLCCCILPLRTDRLNSSSQPGAVHAATVQQESQADDQHQFAFGGTR